MPECASLNDHLILIVSSLGKGNHWENNPAQKWYFSCCSAAIPFPVRQIHEDNFHWQQRRLQQYVQQQFHFLRSKICVQNLAENYNKDDFWKPGVNCRTGNRPNQTHTFLFVCICRYSSVLCDLSDRQHGNLYIISSHYQVRHLVSIWVLPALRVGSSRYSHHTGALCTRQVIVVVIFLLLPEMWPLGSFLFAHVSLA